MEQGDEEIDLPKPKEETLLVIGFKRERFHIPTPRPGRVMTVAAYVQIRRSQSMPRRASFEDV